MNTHVATMAATATQSITSNNFLLAMAILGFFRGSMDRHSQESNSNRVPGRNKATRTSISSPQRFILTAVRDIAED